MVKKIECNHNNFGKMVLNRYKLLHNSEFLCLSKNLRDNIKSIDKDYLECNLILDSTFYITFSDITLSNNRNNKPKNICVRFVDFNNPMSKYNGFWIETMILEMFIQEGILINKNDYLTQINENKLNVQEEIIMEDFKVVCVQFEGGTNQDKKYPYAHLDNLDLTIGDLVVVKPLNHPVTVARVVEFVESPTTEEKRFAAQGRIIIGTTDTSAYEERIAKAKRKAELKRQMDRLVNENKELVLYAALAENSPEMAELLTEYKKLI